MSALIHRIHRPRTPASALSDPSVDLHFDTPTYLLVSNPAATPLFTFLAIFILGMTTGCVVPVLRDWYHGETTPGTWFWVNTTVSLLVNAWTCWNLRGKMVHEITA